MTADSSTDPRRLGAPQESGGVLWDLVNSIDAMIAYWDINQACVFANAAYLQWFGREGRDLVGTQLKDLLGPALYALNLPHIEAAYAGEKQVFERAIPTPDGGIRHSLATYVPHVVDGKIQGIFVHVADVGPLKKLEEELIAAKEAAERLATHDYLTGLPNRAMLDEVIHQAMAQARRRSEGFAVLTVDLDDFKSINDTYGHSGGDRYLIEVARRIGQSVREGDTLLRLGGDEFILVATRIMALQDAREVAARVLQSVGGEVNVDDSFVMPALSIGVAIYPQHGTLIGSLIAASDRAMYAAKHAGKNRYALAD